MRFHYSFSSILLAQSSDSTEWRILIAPCKTLKPHQRESQKCPMQQWKSPLRTYSLGRFAVRTVSTKYLCKDQIMNWIKFWASSLDKNNKKKGSSCQQPGFNPLRVFSRIIWLRCPQHRDGPVLISSLLASNFILFVFSFLPILTFDIKPKTHNIR